MKLKKIHNEKLKARIQQQKHEAHMRKLRAWVEHENKRRQRESERKFIIDRLTERERMNFLYG